MSATEAIAVEAQSINHGAEIETPEGRAELAWAICALGSARAEGGFPELLS